MKQTLHREEKILYKVKLIGLLRSETKIPNFIDSSYKYPLNNFIVDYLELWPLDR